MAQIVVICLELVETAPRMMSLTPRGKGMGWLAYIMYFLSHFHGWTLGESFEASLYTLSLQFLQRKDQGFAALFGIPVVICVDGVFISCTFKFVMCIIFLLLSSTIEQMKC